MACSDPNSQIFGLDSRVSIVAIGYQVRGGLLYSPRLCRAGGLDASFCSRISSWWIQNIRLLTTAEGSF